MAKQILAHSLLRPAASVAERLKFVTDASRRISYDPTVFNQDGRTTATSDVPYVHTGASHSIGRRVFWHNCEPLVIEDCSIDERTKIVGEASGGGFPKFYAGAPIVSKNGFILGTFCVMDEDARSISHQQLDGLRLLADQFVELLDTRQVETLPVKNDDKLAVNGDYYSSATILFADFVGFTQKTEEIHGIVNSLHFFLLLIELYYKDSKSNYHPKMLPPDLID